ncbi:MAG: Gfo/Idh/MocA family oxidoreductase [Clostridia bacterium]
MDKPIRVAMLGMGTMGVRHLDNLRTMDDVQIVALCSAPTDPAVAYNLANKTDYVVYGDFGEMLNKEVIDALYVCLPPFAHDGQIEKAAKKGIHIFTEKPLALSMERGSAIACAVKAGNVYSQMGYHMRFGGAVRMLRQLISEGKTGMPTLFCANYECNSLHVPWWMDRKKSGGQIFEQIIHLYDLAAYIMGDVDSVTGFIANVCHQNIPGYTVEDTSAISLRFKNGTLGCITASNNAIPNRWAGIVRIVFEKMVVELSDHNHLRITYTQPEVRTECFEFEDSAYLDEDRYFVDVVQGKKPEFAPIAEGLSDLAIVAGAVESSANGGIPVKLS